MAAYGRLLIALYRPLLRARLQARRGAGPAERVVRALIARISAPPG
jgi:hypothetical protein